MRDAAAAHRLHKMRATFDLLGESLADGFDGPDSAALGKQIMTVLRGLMVAQLVVDAPVDTANERQGFIDLITTFVEQRDK